MRPPFHNALIDAENYDKVAKPANWNLRESFLAKSSISIHADAGFLVRLRRESAFDESICLETKNQMTVEIPARKTRGFILNCDVAASMGLIDQSDRRTPLFNRKAGIKAENTCVKIEEIINCFGNCVSGGSGCRDL